MRTTSEVDREHQQPPAADRPRRIYHVFVAALVLDRPPREAGQLAALDGDAALRARTCPALQGPGFACSEPFGQAELEVLAPLDRQPFGVDVAEGTAQEVLSLERHGDKVEDSLNGADRPGGPAM